MEVGGEWKVKGKKLVFTPKFIFSNFNDVNVTKTLNAQLQLFQLQYRFQPNINTKNQNLTKNPILKYIFYE